MFYTNNIDFKKEFKFSLIKKNYINVHIIKINNIHKNIKLKIIMSLESIEIYVTRALF